MTLRLPSLDSITGWAGELWSNTNTLKGITKILEFLSLFFCKKKEEKNGLIFVDIFFLSLGAVPILCQPKLGGPDTPFPRCQPKIRNWLTPLTPLSEKNQKLANPPPPLSKIILSIYLMKTMSNAFTQQIRALS